MDRRECGAYRIPDVVEVMEGEGLLWMSPTSFFEEGKPIRGGIPVCFPWFGPHETRADFPLHDVVRTRHWDIESTAELSDGRTRVALSIGDDEITRESWPHVFRLELAVTVGRRLDIVMTTENVGPDPFRYAESLHTYFKTGHAHGCDVEGLDGVGYVDRVRRDSRAVQYGPICVFLGRRSTPTCGRRCGAHSSTRSWGGKSSWSSARFWSERV